jgi:hypothetical protein
VQDQTVGCAMVQGTVMKGIMHIGVRADAAVQCRRPMHSANAVILCTHSLCGTVYTTHAVSNAEADAQCGSRYAAVAAASC